MSEWQKDDGSYEMKTHSFQLTGQTTKPTLWRQIKYRAWRLKFWVKDLRRLPFRIMHRQIPVTFGTTWQTSMWIPRWRWQQQAKTYQFTSKILRSKDAEWEEYAPPVEHVSDRRGRLIELKIPSPFPTPSHPVFWMDDPEVTDAS